MASPISTAKSPRATIMPSEAKMMPFNVSVSIASARSILAIKPALLLAFSSKARASFMSPAFLTNEIAM